MIEYKFANIEADAGEIAGQVGKVNGLLAEGQGALNRLQSVWTGEGLMSYEAVQTRWNQTSEELNLALQNLGQALSTTSGDMSTADAGVGQSFGG